MKKITLWLNEIGLLLGKLGSEKYLTRTQEGPRLRLLNVKISRWAAWLYFGIIAEFLTLYALAMAFIHPPIESKDFIPATGLFVIGLLCFHRAKMYYYTKNGC